jgi:hypothetical protein
MSHLKRMRLGWSTVTLLNLIGVLLPGGPSVNLVGALGLAASAFIAGGLWERGE